MTTTRSRWRRLAELARRENVLSAIGVLSAGFILVETNLLAAQSYVRWDFSEHAQFSLQAPSQELLANLRDDVAITVLLPQGHPLFVDVRHTLDAYRAASDRVSVRYLDPDRDAAAFLALGERYQLSTEQSESGVVFAAAAALVERRGRSWFLSPGALISVDSDGATTQTIERAISEAILRLGEGDKETLCFLAGHGEKSPEDQGPEGLLTLARSLASANIEARVVTFGPDTTQEQLTSCDALAVVGPGSPWPRQHVALLEGTLRSRGRLLLLIDPIVDAAGTLVDPGLSPLTSPFGVHIEPGFILETNPKQRLPQGYGEAFLALPRPHPITRGLHSEDARTDAHVLAVTSQPLQLSGAAVPLLTSTDAGRIARGLLLEPGDTPEDTGVSAVVAAASRLPRDTGEERLVAVGTSQLAESQSLTDPALRGNRLFLQNALAWLMEKPSPLHWEPRSEARSLPPLTEDSLSGLLRYVLIYLPLTAAATGLFILLRRRRSEESSRIGGTS